MIIETINKWSEKFELAKAPTAKDKKHAVKKAVDYLFEEIRETEREFARTNQLELFQLSQLGELVDGFGDVAFVAINGIYKVFRALGQDEERARANTYFVISEITKANEAKLHDGEVVWDDRGKVVKPDNWKSPDFSQLFLPV